MKKTLKSENHSSLSRACGRLTVPRSSLSRVVARRSLAHLSLARFSSLPITHHTGPSPSRSRHSLSPSCNLLRRPISEAAPLSSLSALHLLVGLLTGIVGESGLDGIVYSEIAMQAIKTPKTPRAKRELEKHASKLVENGKKTLFFKNDNIGPFESGGETSLEFFFLKMDCSLFVFGSHSKKRPNNLVLGRTYDHHIYDLVEVGIENFKSMESFSYDKNLGPRVGSKPVITFIGDAFENVEELKHSKEVLLDLFREEVVENLNLAGIDRVYVCVAVSPNTMLFTHYALRLKRSGTVVPRMELPKKKMKNVGRDVYTRENWEDIHSRPKGCRYDTIS
ncbi:hypothetical protein MRB53_026883 [Persea americana]|uniref:Uncharacterized protein n=1 Tax=Persea americana TaxID=3435 RepID=A0ACC2LJG2_PERAE|nr:hypothetical protein MRB53_026883 [Persea americana]